MVLGWFHIDKPSAVLDQKKIGIISARLLVPPSAVSSFTKVVVLPFQRNLIDALLCGASGSLQAGFEGPKFWWSRARTRAFRMQKFLSL